VSCIFRICEIDELTFTVAVIECGLPGGLEGTVFRLGLLQLLLSLSCSSRLLFF